MPMNEEIYENQALSRAGQTGGVHELGAGADEGAHSEAQATGEEISLFYRLGCPIFISQ